MSVLNINKNSPDASDNVIGYRRDSTPEIIKYLAPLALYAGLVITVIWLLGIIANGIWCKIDSYACFDMKLALGWLPVLIISGIILYFIRAGIMSHQDYKNKEYLDLETPRAHRDSIRQHPNSAFNIALQHEKSQATAGMDTYSPSNTSKSDAVSTPLDDEIDMNLIKWDEIL